MPEPRASVATAPKRRRLALVCDSLEDTFQLALVDAALAAAAAHGVDLLVVPAGKLGEMVGKNFLHTLVPQWVDGIIVAAHTIGHTASERQLGDLLRHLGPVPTVSLGEAPGADCCLLIDNERAAYDLTQHLVQRHRLERFVYLSGPVGNRESRERERGFSRALREAALEFDERLLVIGDFTREGGSSAVAELLDARGIDLEFVDAIVCANDAMAVGACFELERRAYRVPTDVAVVGFDDTELARHLPAPLTTARQPLRELLLDAVGMLVDALASGKRPSGSYRYSAEAIHRRSCGCARLPNLPHPSTPDVLTTSGRTSLRVLEPALREDLEDAFVAVLDTVAPSWLGELLETLGAQLAEQGTAFYDYLESLCFGLLRLRKPTSGWQPALLTIRRHVARAGIGSDRLPDLDRLVEGAMRLTSELTTSFLARQREELLERLRVLSDATARLLAAPDLGTIAEVTRTSFPKLGVARGIVYLFSPEFGPGAALTVLSSFGLPSGALLGTQPAARLPDELFGHDWVVEPLGTGPRPLGFALLQCGLAQVSWYERLRDALTAAINGAQLIQQVQRMVVTDPLTGVCNRRYLTQKIRQELEAERDTGRPLSLLVLDLDGFKSLNDQRGHDEGDRALVRAADAIKRCLRESDTLARFGGDEFVVVLPGTTADQAHAIARRVLESMPKALREQVAMALTCSIGIATVDTATRTGDTELFRQADQALLVAKRSGKNRVVHASDM